MSTPKAPTIYAYYDMLSFPASWCYVQKNIHEIGLPSPTYRCENHETMVLDGEA